MCTYIFIVCVATRVSAYEDLLDGKCVMYESNFEANLEYVQIFYVHYFVSVKAG
jgi:hypothetical protein